MEIEQVTFKLVNLINDKILIYSLNNRKCFKKIKIRVFGRFNVHELFLG